LSLNGPYGYVDLPIIPPQGQDRLNVDSYYKGLAEFVTRCETPMTIAVQGDWGSGKSTALNFVGSKLPASVRVIEFNTWLYSQFDLGDSLVFSMAHEILSPIAVSSSSAKRLMRFVATMGVGALKGGAGVVGVATGTSPLVSAVVESLRNATYSDEAPNVIAELKEMRAHFEVSVKEYCAANELDRIAIFIDDLDRVDPRRAIEILESLKLFFEVPQCVFVLALDFDVVVRGVEMKYGSEFKRKKARQYFDKIIQVPFSMPVASFKVDQIVRHALDRSNVLQQSDPESFSRYMKVVQDSVGTNPRSIKRLLNAFELLQLILVEQGTPLAQAENRLPLIVFALLCAQAAYPELHRQIIEEREVESDLDDILSGDENDAGDEALLEGFDIDAADIRRFRRFREYLGVLSSDENGNLDLGVLRQAIALSQVTAVGLSRIAKVEDVEESIDVSGVVEVVRANSTERTTELMSALFDELIPALGERSFSMIAQAASKTITLYTTDDIDGVMESARRARPRFASIAYSRKGLNIIFGRGNYSENRTKPYGDEWEALATRLKDEFPEDGGAAGARFEMRDSSYPLALNGIVGQKGMGAIGEALRDVYDVVMEYRSGKVEVVEGRRPGSM
jgi:hypothetical protein